MPGQFDESSNGPTQKTSYDTSDDPGADPDNPAGDGEGSRNNYTEIGNVGLTYDNNRNLQADGTREFRYNYRNQLRKVWRKSDGDSDGLVSQYREDAFGRRVLTHSWWELARRVYLDTRFELDVNMDADGDTVDLEYINGGITSTASAPISHPHQLAEWESRIYRTHASLESHYYDFLVYVPDVDVGTYTGDVYRGMLGVGDYELLIYHDRYELWDFTGSPTLLDTSYATTSGWHNIGLRAGIGAGVWVDGSQIMAFGVGMYINEKVKFGTLHNTISYMNGEEPAVVEAEGIELYENLNYLRSYNRSQADMSQPPWGDSGGYPVGGMRAVHTPMDGGQTLLRLEIDDNGSGAAAVYIESECEEDAGRWRHYNTEGEYTDLALPDVRRNSGVIIRDRADGLVNDEGEPVPNPEEELLPGVALRILTDAVGAQTPYVHIDPYTGTTVAFPSGFDGSTPPAGLYTLAGKCTCHGDGDSGWIFNPDILPDDPTSHPNPVAPGMKFGGADATPNEGQNLQDRGRCACREGAPNEDRKTASKDTSTGADVNDHDGKQGDDHSGTATGEGGSTFVGSDGQTYHSEEVNTWWMIDGVRYTEMGGKVVRWVGASVIGAGKCNADSGRWEEVADPSETLLAALQFGLGIMQGVADEIIGIVESLEAIMELVNTAISDWEVFQNSIVAGLESVANTIRDAAGGDPDAMVQALALLDPAIANFLSVTMLGKTLGGESSTPFLVGAALGAVIVTVAIYIATSGAGGAGKAAAKTGTNIVENAGEAAADVAKKTKKGIYEFPDQKAGGKPYVGQSENIPERLKKHENDGRLKRGTESCTEIEGGKTEREVAEHKRVQEITGGKKAKSSPNVANKKDPIGPNRRPDQGLPEPRD